MKTRANSYKCTQILFYLQQTISSLLRNELNPIHFSKHKKFGLISRSAGRRSCCDLDREHRLYTSQTIDDVDLIAVQLNQYYYYLTI